MLLISTWSIFSRDASDSEALNLLVGVMVTGNRDCRAGIIVEADMVDRFVQALESVKEAVSSSNGDYESS